MPEATPNATALPEIARSAEPPVALLPAPVIPSEETALLAELLSRAQKFAREARAENTLRAYRSDWLDFEGWCGHRRFVCCPASPETVALYLTALSRTHKVSTLTRRISAISQAHQIAGFSSPTEESPVRLVMAGIRRSLGTAVEGKRPVLVPDLLAMVTALPDNLLGLRDRVLLLIGFLGAFRRSELVGLDWEDLAETVDGLVITIRRIKTDQEAEGRKIAIPRGSEESTCPLRALSLWRAAGIESGPVFLRVNRHGQILRKRLSARSSRHHREAMGQQNRL